MDASLAWATARTPRRACQDRRAQVTGALRRPVGLGRGPRIVATNFFGVVHMAALDTLELHVS